MKSSGVDLSDNLAKSSISVIADSDGVERIIIGLSTGREIAAVKLLREYLTQDQRGERGQREGVRFLKQVLVDVKYSQNGRAGVGFRWDKQLKWKG